MGLTRRPGSFQFIGDGSDDLTGASAGNAGASFAMQPLPNPGDSSTSGIHDVVFIDSRVPDIEDLLNGLKPGEMAFVIDSGSDGLNQIAAILKSRHLNNLAGIQIVSHGTSGALELGATTLNGSNLSGHAGALAGIGAALVRGGDLSLYACDVAQGRAGQQFIADLSKFAGGVNIAASTHVIGLTAGGENWTLDAFTGAPVTAASIPFTAQARANFQGVLILPPPQIYNPDNVVTAAGTGAIALDIAAPTDVGDANTPTITLNDVPTYGTVQYFNGSAFVAATSGTILTPAELASLEYIPPASGEFGGQTISYTAADGAASVQGTIAITVVADDTGPASLYFSAFGGTGNNGNPDLYTLNASGNPVAKPLNVANGSFAGEDGGFFQFAGNLYFNANGTATSDTEALYKLDPSGTVTAVSAGANNADGFFDAISEESANFTEFDGSLYFGALVNTGGQVVKLNADGSSQVITLDLNSESFAGLNGGFVEFNGDLYFSAITTTTNGFGPDLIQLDPNGNVTEISTRIPANAAFGSNAGEDGGFYVFNNTLYFNATSDTLGDPLFELTAGSITPVPVDPTGNVLSHTGIASGFHQFDGSLYFNEQSGALFDDTLFKLDAGGTLTPLTFFNGTTQETLENAGALGGFVDFAGSTYFVANTAGEGTQLFQLDGSGTITEITDTQGGAFDDTLPGNFIVFAGNLYFDAYDSGGDSLYKLAPGTTTPTVAYSDSITQAGVDGGFQVVNGSLYFSAYSTDGYQLVQLNADGTTRIIDIAPPVNNSFDTPGNTNALGVFPNNVIIGPAGNDILVGGTADETIVGGPGNNMLEGRGGNDTLIGGGGTNDFVFSAAGPANVDTVTNYSLAHGDTLDVSALVDTNFTAQSSATEFVRLTASGSNDLLLQVDPGGGVGGHVWEDVAILEDANVLAVNQVTAFLGGADYTITQSFSPTIAGTLAGQTTVSEVPVKPFSGVTITDVNNGGTDPDTLSITFSGGGTLAGTGLSGSNGSYSLTGTAASITTELDALSFTPVTGVPNTQATTTFTLGVNDGIDPVVTDSTTSVVTKYPSPSFDFTGGHASGVLLQSGSNLIDWSLSNGSYSGYNPIGNTLGFGTIGTGDFNADGTTDILLQDGSGNMIDWLLNNGQYASYAPIGNANVSGFNVVRLGDVNGDGTSDILLENGSGALGDWIVQNGTYSSYNGIGNTLGYNIIGTGDFNGDGTTDVLLQDAAGNVIDWTMEKGTFSGWNQIANPTTVGYGVVGTGDFNGDGTTDILLENGGNLIDWTIQNGQWAAWNQIGNTSGYNVVGTGDYNGDGTSDILLQNASGNVIDWIMQNGQFSTLHEIGSAGAFAVVNK
jgi:hypothetical protein